MRGEVVGINTAIASRSGGYQGIGFALPINTAAAVYNADHQERQGDARRHRHQLHAVRRPYAPALLKANGANEGVFVQTVYRRRSRG